MNSNLDKNNRSVIQDILICFLYKKGDGYIKPRVVSNETGYKRNEEFKEFVSKY